MRAIFISYRRNDAEGEAGRLFDDLVREFGDQSVFMDVSTIQAGRDFRKVIDESVATCGVLLSIMGVNWLDAKDEAGERRLDDPADFVRLETASALKRDIPVIPVLVRGAKMPRADALPDDLKDLAYRNGAELTHARWSSDVQLLIKALRPFVGESKGAPASPSTSVPQPAAEVKSPVPVETKAPAFAAETFPTQKKKPLGMILGVVAAILVTGAAAAYLMMPRQVTVPDLTGTTLPSATAKLQELKLAVGQTTPKDDPTKDPNTVLGQSPSANTTVKSGTTVDLVISQRTPASAMVEVPSLVGKSLDVAKQALEDRQLAVGAIDREASSDKPKDTVVSEFPSAGQKVQVGAKVDLRIAAGKAPPPTPEVTQNVTKSSASGGAAAKVAAPATGAPVAVPQSAGSSTSGPTTNPTLTQQLTLSGAGGTFPYPIYSKWFSEYHNLHSNIQINYQAIGSGGGIHQVQTGAVDFGATDGPMSDEQIATSKVKVLHLPTVLGAVVPVYNIPGVNAELKFTPEILAGVFLGKITNWNDPSITVVNREVKFPNQAITVVHRSDGSGTTYVWTDYLRKVSPEWQGSVGNGTSVKWPVGVGGKGDEGVAGMVRSLPGSIGYVELIYALQNKISFGAVQNSSKHFIKASLGSTTAASVGLNMPADFRASITNPPGENAYPIASFTWLLIPTSRSDANKAKILKDFLLWMLSTGQTMTDALSYAPLPKAVVEMEKTAITQQLKP